MEKIGFANFVETTTVAALCQWNGNHLPHREKLTP
jgi:hypothetical protein